MYRLFTLLLITIFSLIIPNKAMAIIDPLISPNNIVGVHILHVSEISRAASIVNNGGDWGYITIPIQPTDRGKIKWNTFMQKAKDLHIIPILRVTTIPRGGTWEKGTDTDLVDFANFLYELTWPTKNKYVIIFNEVNRAQEWGDEVDPSKYANILKNASIIFKERSDDFFILPAGLDSALPNSSSSMSSYDYLKKMQEEIPDIWEYIDGWTSHSYPNPGFSASPYKVGWQSITSYKQELATIGKNLPVFITESGWDNNKLSPHTLANYYRSALDTWSNDKNIVTANIFLLDAQDGPFTKFSLIGSDGLFTTAGTVIFNYPKLSGQPIISLVKPTPSTQSFLSRLTSRPNFVAFAPLLKLENLIRTILGLPPKLLLKTNTVELTVEVVTKSKDITKGLSGRKSLGTKQGMLFKFKSAYVASFWMKDMNFPIDIVWIKDNIVVDVTENAQPQQTKPYIIYAPTQSVNMVLEIGSGLAKKYGLNVGQSIQIREP